MFFSGTFRYNAGMALSDAKIFAIVLPILHLQTSADVIDTLGGLHDVDFNRAFDLHTYIRWTLDREESRAATEEWMREVDWDSWPEPTEEDLRYLRMVDERSAELYHSHGPVEAIEGAIEKMKKIENGLLSRDLFSKARRK